MLSPFDKFWLYFSPMFSVYGLHLLDCIVWHTAMLLVVMFGGYSLVLLLKEEVIEAQEELIKLLEANSHPLLGK